MMHKSFSQHNNVKHQIEVDKRNVSQIADVKDILNTLGFVQEKYIGTLELQENQIKVKKGDL